MVQILASSPSSWLTLGNLLDVAELLSSENIEDNLYHVDLVMIK